MEIFEYAENLDIKNIKKLINKSININIKNQKGGTVLQYICSGYYHRKYEKNARKIVKLLINSGADCNITKGKNYSALMGAIRSGSKKLVKL